MNIHNYINRAHEDAQRRAIQMWAEAAAANGYHEIEIIVPPEFNRQQALSALEIAVILKYSLSPLVQLGQGRTSADTRWSDASLALTLALGVAIGLAALAAIVWWAI